MPSLNQTIPPSPDGTIICSDATTFIEPIGHRRNQSSSGKKVEESPPPAAATTNLPSVSSSTQAERTCYSPFLNITATPSVFDISATAALKPITEVELPQSDGISDSPSKLNYWRYMPTSSVSDDEQRLINPPSLDDFRLSSTPEEREHN